MLRWPVIPKQVRDDEIYSRHYLFHARRHPELVSGSYLNRHRQKTKMLKQVQHDGVVLCFNHAETSSA
jgi:hypothetical protein